MEIDFLPSHFAYFIVFGIIFSQFLIILGNSLPFFLDSETLSKKKKGLVQPGNSLIALGVMGLFLSHFCLVVVFSMKYPGDHPFYFKLGMEGKLVFHKMNINGISLHAFSYQE